MGKRKRDNIHDATIEVTGTQEEHDLAEAAAEGVDFELSFSEDTTALQVLALVEAGLSEQVHDAFTEYMEPMSDKDRDATRRRWASRFAHIRNVINEAEKLI